MGSSFSISTKKDKDDDGLGTFFQSRKSDIVESPSHYKKTNNKDGLGKFF
jgi:hypothetical protein